MGEDLAMKPTPGAKGMLIALLGAGLLIRLLIAWAPFSYLASRGPLIDDAFYSFGIARNVAEGRGFTADGVHPTSGFQPLYTFLLVPFYFLSRDPIVPIHAGLTMLAIAGAATGWFVFRITRRLAGTGAALFSLSLWTFSPYFLTQGLNGLETGLFGFLLAVSVDYYLGAARGDGARPAPVLLGALLAGLVLARVDGLIPAVLILGALLHDALRVRRRLGRFLTALSTMSLLVLPYFLFLRVKFGSFLPESGAATRFLSLCYGTLFVAGPAEHSYFPLDQVPWSYYALSLAKAVQALASQPLLFPASIPLAVMDRAGIAESRPPLAAAGGMVLLLANLIFLRGAVREGGVRDYARFALGAAALWIPAYAFGALGQWWFPRYFFPLFLLMLPASGLAFRLAGERLPLLRSIPSAPYAALAIGAQLFLFGLQAPGAFFTHRANLNISSFLRMALVLDAAIPAGARAGAFQSGTLSYFGGRTVVNLDGVVNGGALEALREKRMAEYVQQEGIRAVIDYPLILQALLVRRSAKGEARRLGEGRQVGGFYLVLVEPPPDGGAGPDPGPTHPGGGP